MNDTTHPITTDSEIPFPCWLRQNFSWKYHRIAVGVRTGEYIYFGFTHYDTSPADKKPEWPAGPLNAPVDTEMLALAEKIADAVVFSPAVAKPRHLRVAAIVSAMRGEREGEP